ncbi:unnamed protein product [Boreogadus saida]
MLEGSRVSGCVNGFTLKSTLDELPENPPGVAGYPVSEAFATERLMKKLRQEYIYIPAANGSIAGLVCETLEVSERLYELTRRRCLSAKRHDSSDLGVVSAARRPPSNELDSGQHAE